MSWKAQTQTQSKMREFMSRVKEQHGRVMDAFTEYRVPIHLKHSHGGKATSVGQHR